MDNSALIPSEGPQNQLTQQGSIDWIQLARTTISFPMSVLARLAAADIAPHTVVIGQRMSSIFVLSTTGMERLTDALQRLPSCSSIGNVIWFGFGIRHIVREIAQTAQGVTLLTLCGSLAELHGPEACARILMKLAHISGAPREQQPSPQQWVNMIESCAGILRPTTFGCIAAQFMAFCPGEDHQQAGDAEDVARALHALALLSSKALDSITLVGGQSCGWIAAFGYFFLGLDVEIHTEDGALCYRSAADTGEVHIFVIYESGRAVSSSQVQIRGRAYRVKTMDPFLPHWENSFKSPMSGSVPWERCLNEIFGDSAVRLLEARKPFGNMISCAARVFQGLANAEPYRVFDRDTYKAWFGFQAGQSGVGFVDSAISWFPELSSLRSYVPLDLGGTVDAALRAYAASGRELDALCGCWRCTQNRVRHHHRTSPYCLVTLAETIIFLVWNISGMRLEADLKPYRTGLRFLYDLLAGNAETESTLGRRFGERGALRGKRSRPCLRSLVQQLDVASVYHTAQFLFTTDMHPQTTCFEFTSAAVGGICFYFNLLREVSDAPEKAVILHVLPGSIATSEGRKYPYVVDKMTSESAGLVELVGARMGQWSQFPRSRSVMPATLPAHSIP